MTTTIYTARQVVTLDSERPRTEAVAVRDSRIVAVGSLAELKAELSDEDWVIDSSFADHIVLPGLIDQHLHPVLGSATLTTEVIATEDWVLPGVTYPAAHNHEEYIAALRAGDAKLDDPNEWLLSWGYHSLWHGELNREILDSVNETRPIGIWQRSCHEFYLNSAAIESLGLRQNSLSATPEALAMIDLEKGHFWERGLFGFLFPMVMPLLLSPERFERGLKQMVRYLHQNGVTAFNEPGAIRYSGAWELYEKILGDEATPFYSYFVTDGRGPAEAGMSHEASLERAETDFERAPRGKVSYFKKQVKLFADGAIISQLMQMSDPYLDAHGDPNPDHHGEWLMPPEMLDERSKLYWDEGFQLHIHVNGDLGLEVVLDTIERRMTECPRIGHRTVIVHFANSTEAQIDRIASLGAVVSANPYYPVGFADKYGQVGLGPQRADAMVRSRSVLDRDIPLSFHSDLPMGPADPLAMMHFAVNRITQSGRVAGPEQRISAEEALRAVTIGAAHSWQREHELGTIEIGKIANFTVVDANPLDVDPTRINEIDVIGTVFEGGWFPVPRGASRVAAGRAEMLQHHDDAIFPGAGTDDISGCVCGVAKEILHSLQQSQAA